MKKFPVKTTALLLSVLLTSSSICALGNENAQIRVDGNEELNGSVTGSDRGKTAEELRSPSIVK